jgi:DNA-binding Lrp family transcriptional regulator
MEDINSTIIEILKKDARTPFLQIAKQLNVSEGTIRKRVKDLIKNDQIKKFTIETSEDAFAIVGIETETKTETKGIVGKIQSFGITNIYEVTGRFDIICLVPSLDREKVNEVLEQIRTTQGVLHTETFTILKKN